MSKNMILMLTLDLKSRAPECRGVINLQGDETSEQTLDLAKAFTLAYPEIPFVAELWSEGSRLGFFDCMNGKNLQDASIEQRARKAGVEVPSLDSCREKLKAAGLYDAEALHGMKVTEVCKIIDLKIPQSILDMFGPELTYGELVGKYA